MISVFLIKADRVLLTRRYRDERWQASCVGNGSGAQVAQKTLYDELGIHERLIDCGSDVYRSVTNQGVSTTPEIDDIEWVLIEDLPRFAKNHDCDASLLLALNTLLESLGSSIRVA